MLEETHISALSILHNLSYKATIKLLETPQTKTMATMSAGTTTYQCIPCLLLPILQHRPRSHCPSYRRKQRPRRRPVLPRYRNRWIGHGLRLETHVPVRQDSRIKRCYISIPVAEGAACEVRGIREESSAAAWREGVDGSESGSVRNCVDWIDGVLAGARKLVWLLWVSRATCD